MYNLVVIGVLCLKLCLSPHQNLLSEVPVAANSDVNVLATTTPKSKMAAIPVVKLDLSYLIPPNLTNPDPTGSYLS